MKIPEELIYHLEHEIKIGNVDKKVQNLILLIAEQNKKYKEVIDKAIEYIKENDELLYIKYWDTTCDGEFYDWYVESDFTKKLLDILKEVE